MNANNWDGGNFGGVVGLYEKGNENSYYDPDFENNTTHSFEFAGSGAYVTSQYEEASGAPVFDSSALNNMVITSGAFRPTDNSPGNNSNFWWGPEQRTELNWGEE